MPIQTPLYPHAFVVPEAYTYSFVNVSLAGGATHEGPTIVPAAVVNPNTAIQSADTPSVGHILTAIVFSTVPVPVFHAIFQVKFPAGSDTWQTILDVAFVGTQLVLDNALSVLYLPCVPQFRMNIFNPSGTLATIDGAMTLYSI